MDATAQEHLELLQYEPIGIGALNVAVEGLFLVAHDLPVLHRNRRADDDGSIVEVEPLHGEVGTYLPICLLIANPDLGALLGIGVVPGLSE